MKWPNVPSETLRKTLHNSFLCVGQLTCAWRSSAEPCWILFFRPSYRDNAWARLLCLMIGFACVCCGIKPPIFSMGSHNSIPIHPLAGHRRLLHMYTRRRYRRLLWTLSPVFSKDRSRVWLMSRLSWTGWRASKTPWFPLTTYHRRQKMKREGNKYSCIVHYINTCTFEHKKLTKFPMSVSHHI